MPQHVMLDLETLGTATSSLILSIGAVKFDPNGEGVDDAFHVVIDPRDAQRHGQEISADTVLWWMDSARDEARAELLSHKDTWVDLFPALDEFQTWFGFDSMPVWGNSAAFDNEMLKAAFKRFNMEPPWKFWDDRCYRTVKNLVPAIKLARVGTYHSAVDDARSQAEHLQKILAHITLEV